MRRVISTLIGLVILSGIMGALNSSILYRSPPSLYSGYSASLSGVNVTWNIPDEFSYRVILLKKVQVDVKSILGTFGLDYASLEEEGNMLVASSGEAVLRVHKQAPELLYRAGIRLDDGEFRDPGFYVERADLYIDGLKSGVPSLGAFDFEVSVEMGISHFYGKVYRVSGVSVRFTPVWGGVKFSPPIEFTFSNSGRLARMKLYAWSPHLGDKVTVSKDDVVRSLERGEYLYYLNYSVPFGSKIEEIVVSDFSIIYYAWMNPSIDLSNYDGINAIALLRLQGTAAVSDGSVYSWDVLVPLPSAP